MLNIYTQQKVVCTGYSLVKINFSYIIHFTKDKVFATGQKSCFTYEFDVIVVHRNIFIATV